MKFFYNSHFWLPFCIICTLLVLSNCGQESQFSGLDINETSTEDAYDSDSTASIPSKQDDDPQPQDEPTEDVAEDNLNLIEVKYSFGQADPIVDYLFIIDNSSSMFQIIDKVNQGFNSLQEAGVFPPKSLVAVMNSMIADPSDYSSPSPFLTAYTGIEQEPGFLDFVNKSAIASYRSQVSNFADRWPLDGCEAQWFKPQDKNDGGDYCLAAATQSTFSSLGVEAGIQAFEQLLLKNAGKTLFRKNALVNVIFVSDTHDPGTNSAELKESIPEYSKLYNAATSSNTIAGLKFHALAPFEKCTSEGLHDQSYFKLVQESKGQQADSCKLDNYQGFLASMIEASKVAEPKFQLKHPLNTIVKVLVDGEEVSKYETSEDENFIVLNSLDPLTPVEVTIIYAVPKTDSGITDQQ